MEQAKSFHYTYSAKDNQEMQDIRKKYLSHEENKLEELKRLDNLVQPARMVESLYAGIGDALVFGLGMCLSVKVIGNGAISMTFGILLGIVGTIAMLAAYPIYQRLFAKAKERHTPRILKLTEELTSECHEEVSE